MLETKINSLNDNEENRSRKILLSFVSYGFCGAAAIFILWYSASEIWKRCTRRSTHIIIVASEVADSQSQTTDLETGDYQSSDWTDNDQEAVIEVEIHRLEEEEEEEEEAGL